MGAGSSRSRSSRATNNGHVAGGTSAVRLNFASFLCGGASTATAASCRGEDEASEISLIGDGSNNTVIVDSSHLSIKESPVRSSSTPSVSSSSTTCPSRSYGLEESTVDLKYAESSDSGKGLCIGEVIAPHLENGDFHVTCAGKSCDFPSTSGKQEAHECMSAHADTIFPPLTVSDNTASTDTTQGPITPLSSLSQLESGRSPSNFTSSNSNPVLHDGNLFTPILNPTFSISNSSITSQLAGEDCPTEPTSSASTLQTTSSLGERRNGGVLHLDVISISSVSPSSYGEARASESGRMSRRLLLNSLSRRTSRRSSFQSIFSSIEDARDLEYQDRSLLDVDDRLFEIGAEDDFVNLRRRRHGIGGWDSRSELRDLLRGGGDDSGSTNTCPSRLHPVGTCSCYSFSVADTSTARASISRIVMLAEALFEILDEIHRQPASLFSMVCLPAPDSVVDSLPIKTYNKVEETGSGEDPEQCRICLTEYEEGDNIRVLPCHHEYHIWCVDKWLKEIHGVCPLCRGDVCQVAAEVSAI